MARPELMLAQRGSVDSIDFLTKRGFLFDLKIDGIRCYTRIVDGRVDMRSRSGEEISARFPEVSSVLRELFPTGTWVLDGELAAHDERGLPSWPLTHKRAAQGGKRAAWAAQTWPATYHVFDMLYAGHRDLRATAYVERRAEIDQRFTVGTVPSVVAVLHTPSGEALWDTVQRFRLEGMIAKRSDHRYKPGRSGDWVKIKRTSTLSALVGGFDEGTGSRASTFGALHLYLLNEANELVAIGKVGSGFSELEVREVNRRMRESSLIVEVEYLDVSPDGQLRQPVFLRVRDDQQISDCTTDQLEGA